MARTGKGTRLMSIIHIKGDMFHLLLRRLSMTPKGAMRRPDEYLQRRASSNLLISRAFGAMCRDVRRARKVEMTKKRRKFVAMSRKFPPAFEGGKTWLDGCVGTCQFAARRVAWPQAISIFRVPAGQWSHVAGNSLIATPSSPLDFTPDGITCLSVADTKPDGLAQGPNTWRSSGGRYCPGSPSA